MEKPLDPVMAALVAHDRAIGRQYGCWVGAEATYTDAASDALEWLTDAAGSDKYARAERMLTWLARISPHAAVLRCAGRPYVGELVPRWCLGVYARRDGTPVWQGPPDPLLTHDSGSVPPAEAFARVLTDGLRLRGMRAVSLRVSEVLPARVAFRSDGQAPPDRLECEPELARPSVHEQRIDGAELRDPLAENGTFLVACGRLEHTLRVELPLVADVRLFQMLLDALASAGAHVGVGSIMLAGYPPPVDETVEWTTLTSDPAVLEVNLAPEPGSAGLLRRLRTIDGLARREGLSPFRLQYNGEERDSGGGGQVTLGGPRPEASPFLRQPQLLPSLIRYFNRHPALSYWSAPDSVGPDSQAPRADEGVREWFHEFSLTLELLLRDTRIAPDTLWSALAPFLVDRSGNPHRAEINIDKLWNPLLGARGRQGLVEFRALRMGARSEIMAARAALLRAVVAMLAEHPLEGPLIDWGDTLHHRFSLPFYLERDLREVFSDLEASGLGLGEPLVALILEDGHRRLAERVLEDCRVEIRRAVEYWPLVGDASMQEREGSRLIDSSTARVELRLRPNIEGAEIDVWSVNAAGWTLPLVREQDERGPLRLVGVRYRSFKPFQGWHPTLGVQAPLHLTFSHPRHGLWRLTLHEWRPDGGPYAGLPADILEARARRNARCVIEKLHGDPPLAHVPPHEALQDCIVDLRWR